MSILVNTLPATVVYKDSTLVTSVIARDTVRGRERLVFPDANTSITLSFTKSGNNITNFVLKNGGLPYSLGTVYGVYYDVGSGLDRNWGRYYAYLNQIPAGSYGTSYNFSGQVDSAEAYGITSYYPRYLVYNNSVALIRWDSLEDGSYEYILIPYTGEVVVTYGDSIKDQYPNINTSAYWIESVSGKEALFPIMDAKGYAVRSRQLISSTGYGNNVTKDKWYFDYFSIENNGNTIYSYSVDGAVNSSDLCLNLNNTHVAGLLPIQTYLDTPIPLSASITDDEGNKLYKWKVETLYAIGGKK